MPRLFLPWIRSLLPISAVELKARHGGRGGALMWLVGSPLLEILAYTAAFSLVLAPERREGDLPFVLFVATGILPWSALRDSVEGAPSLLGRERWIRRSRVPFDFIGARHVVVSSARGFLGLVLVGGAIGVLSLLPALPAREPSESVALLTKLAGLASGLASAALGIAAQAVLSYGAVRALMPLGTLFPGVRPLVGSALTLLVFGAPVVYPETGLSVDLAAAIAWNPYTHVLRLLRSGLVDGPPADLTYLATWCLLTPLCGALTARAFDGSARDRL